jgi:predicted 2-oxoglutarate/Fe(II)-dependent dioxygenase YbiX
MPNSGFYIIAKEPGAENPAIPAWANDSLNPASFAERYESSMQRKDIDEVDGVFQITNVLSDTECQSLVEITESLGYQQDAAVSLPRSVRHNDSVTWIVDDLTSEIIWQRCSELLSLNSHLFFHKKALGLNNRFRFYRYGSGDYFSPHTDGAWSGSRAIDGKLVQNAFDDRWSQLTFLLFLTDGYEGGCTRFLTKENHHDVRTPKGGVLCFPHGTHPLHCVHSSEPITSGTKVIVRSDVLFEI